MSLDQSVNLVPIYIDQLLVVIYRDKMDELRMYIENEGWELCPVKSSFHILNLVVSCILPRLFSCRI